MSIDCNLDNDIPIICIFSIIQALSRSSRNLFQLGLLYLKLTLITIEIIMLLLIINNHINSDDNNHATYCQLGESEYYVSPHLIF